MHWDQGSWTVVSTASTVLLAVWAAVQGALKIKSDQREAREKIEREVADKERERRERDDPAVLRERRAVERGGVDLDACWKQVDRWKSECEAMQRAEEAREARWAEVGLTDAEGLRTIKRWQDSLGRNAAKEVEAGGIGPPEGETEA